MDILEIAALCNFDARIICGYVEKTKLIVFETALYIFLFACGDGGKRIFLRREQIYMREYPRITVCTVMLVYSRLFLLISLSDVAFDMSLCVCTNITIIEIY